MLRNDTFQPKRSSDHDRRRRLSILVTGGAGFIGSHLCDRLIQQGHTVTCIDNLQTGQIVNIRALQNHARFRFVECDVRKPLEFSEPLHQIYNLACAASPRHYQRDPIGTLETCVSGMRNVLDLAHRHSARVLQASTSEVYGDPELHPQTEDYVGHVNPIGPRACYDEGKRAAETLACDYHRVHGLPVRIARIFNTYGPRMLENDGRVVSNFIVQALRNEPLTVHGSGDQTRSFCYVDDLVDGLMRLMSSGDHVADPCNLGNPHEMCIREIAELIITMTGSRSRIVHHALPQDDPRRRRPDITRAIELLDWRPRVPFHEGLKATIGHFALRIFAGSSPPLVPVLAPRAPRGRKKRFDPAPGSSGLVALASQNYSPRRD